MNIKNNAKNPGNLYIVATPIGNVNDMTFRAVEVLNSVDLIVAEDTRHSLPLLKHFAIATPIKALHEHNEREFSAEIIEQVKKGISIALISDAGTPLISDPGYHLVNHARQAEIKVIPIPGACAAIAALSVAGLPTDSFLFAGFLPAKTIARQQKLENFSSEPRTLIFYEAPHRILEMLIDLAKIFGNERKVVIARELTKLFETILSGKISDVIAQMESDPNQQRGEFVVVVEGASENNLDDKETQQILALLLDEIPLKKAAEIVAKITGGKKNAIYDLGLQLKKADRER